MHHKRRTFRTAAALISVSAIAFGTVACSSTPDSASNEASSDEPVTLVLANSQWLDALRGENLWNAVKLYEEEHPNVTLEQEAIPSAEFADKITTEMGAGQGPDIVISQEGVFFTLAEAGLLVPLDDALEDADLNATNANGEVDGEQLGVAWQRAVYAMIYNDTLLEAAGAEAPTDINSLISAATAVQETSGAAGFTARHQISDFSGWFMDFQNWAYGFGGSWEEDGELTIDTPENVAAVEAFKEVYEAGIIPIGDDMPTMRTRMKENQAAISIDNSGGTLNISLGGALQSSELASSALPFENPGAHQQLFLGVSTLSDNQQAALDFTEWFVSDEAQAAMRLASGPDALATDVDLDPDFVAANPWAQTFADLAEDSRSTLIPGYEVETTQIMRSVMEAVERVITSDADPATEMEAAQAEVDAEFSK